MRILSLRFRNLNSLAGEWLVDLTDPAYADGLFAITGPTGAGKTTLLDALCLALHGATPRLGEISAPLGGEIMARGAGDAMAEVVFSVPTGRFCALWRQRRARGRPDGALQPPSRELSDLTDPDHPAVRAERIREMREEIINLTGMDFLRFTRSTLLAQGEFAAFLQAGPDERGPILEQITGTEIYGELSRLVHRRHAEEHRRHEQFAAELSGLVTLSEEETRNLQTHLEDLARDETAVRGAVALRRAARDRRERSLALAADAAKRAVERDAARAAAEAAAPERHRLTRAWRALELSDNHARVAAARRRRDDDAAPALALAAAIPELERLAAETDAAANQAAAAASRDDEDYRAALERARLVRTLEARRGDDEADRDCALTAAGQTAQRLAELRDNRARTACELERLQADADKAQARLAGHADDAALEERLPALLVRLNAAADADSRVQSAAIEAFAAAARLTKAESARQAAAAAWTRSQEDHAARRHSLETTEGELAGLRPPGDGGDWHEQAASLREQALRLDSLDALRTDIAGLLRTRADLVGREAEAAAARDAARRALHDAMVEAERRDGDHRAAAEAVARLRRDADLGRYRPDLRDGEPCPLCGALEHPLARAASEIPEAASLAAAEAEAARSEASAKTAAEMLARLRLEHHGRLGDAERAAERIRENDARRAPLVRDAAERFAEAAAASGAGGLKAITPPAAPPPDDEPAWTVGLTRLRGACQDAQRGVAAVLNRIAELETARAAAAAGAGQARDAENRAEFALHAADLALDQARLASQQAGEKAAAAAESLRRLQKELRETLPVDDNAAISDFADADGKQPAKAGADSRYAQLGRDLVRRRDAWRELSRDLDDARRGIPVLEARLSWLDPEIARLAIETADRQAAADALVKACERRRGEWSELLGGAGPDADTIEHAAAKTHAAVGAAARDAAEAARAACGRLAAAREEAAAKTEASRRSSSMCEAEEAEWNQALIALGFADGPDFEAARLPADAREKLAGRLESLDRAVAESDARAQAADEALAAAIAAAEADPSLEEAAEALARAEEDLRTLQEKTGGLRQRLADDAALRIRRSERAVLAEAQLRESLRWKRLHGLIGSEKGDKYRNFAQGLAFQRLLRHTNRQLEAMTDRYQCVRHAANPLDFNMVDLYQGGEIRSPKNLSGGESFLASLALALGLSRMGSRRAPVDSLFLDEGFGALDEEALETALDALAALRRDGKLIGVISHVSALRERIETRIEVRPVGGGRSVLLGPGCRAQ